MTVLEDPSEWDEAEPEQPSDDQLAAWEAEHEALRFDPTTGHLGTSRKPGPAVPIRPDVQLPKSQLDAWERHKGSLIDWDTFWQVDHTPEDWLVEPFLARGRQHSIYAPAKAGKSLFVLDVVARLATGGPCLDQGAGQPRKVLYLDMEMTPDDVRERLEDMGYGPETDLTNLYYQSLPALPPLDTPGGALEVIELAQHYAVDLVVVDTLSRVIAGGENDSDTMRAFYSHTGRPLKSAGISMLRLDHTGKDLERGQRGTSAKTDDVDVVWELTRRSKANAGGDLTGPPRFRLRATHRRMGWVPEHVDLVQQDGPLRYEIDTDTWPAGTAEAAAALDRLGVALEATRRTAGAALRANDCGVRNDVLAAALRWRRQKTT